MSGTTPSRDRVHVKYRKIRTADLTYDDKFLERGTYGDVRKATWQGKSVAVKMFSCAERKGGFSEELVCLSMLHEHTYIVNLHGAHLGDSHSDRPFLVLEFAPFSLEKVLHHCLKELRYTADHVMSWTVQMTIALEFIHSQQMLHRDIKPSNILLFQDGCVLKLCDFGTARKLEHTLTNAVGTSWYMAPEVIRGTCYTASCDVYSFGVVLWEMITRHKPYLAGTRDKPMAPQSVLYRVATGGRPPMISRLPKCLEELIKRCWDEGSHKRPTFLEIKTKLEKLVKLIKIEMGKPFIHLRQQKVSVEAEKGAESQQRDSSSQEDSPPQPKSSDLQKPSGKEDPSHHPPPTSSPHHPPPTSPPHHPPPTSHPPHPPPTSPPHHQPPTSPPHHPPPTSHPPQPPPTSSPHHPPPTSPPQHPPPTSHPPQPPPTSHPHHPPPTSSPHHPPPTSPPQHPPPISHPHHPPPISPPLPPSLLAQPSPPPPPSSRTPPPSTSTPPPSSLSPSHIPPSQSTPSLSTTSHTPRRPQNITSTPISQRAQAPQHTPVVLTQSERRHLYKQQSTPVSDSPRVPEVLEDPMSSSYPHGKLSPFLERRAQLQVTPSNHSLQYGSPPVFSPPVAHQDSRMSAVIELEGEEEDVVSQQQRRAWFQQVEKKSKSGEWDGNDGPAQLMVFPTAQSGVSPYAIPGLEDRWQPVEPDPADAESMHYYNQYKEVAQHVLQSNAKIAALSELCAKLDQELSRDKTILDKNKSSQHTFQALLNQKDVMMNELQQIKDKLRRRNQ